jgi:hypothetical protein
VGRWDAGPRPADALDLGDVAAELAGQMRVTAVVEPALAAGVLDLAHVSEAVCGLVEQGAEHVHGTAPQPFTAYEHFGTAGRGGRVLAVGLAALLAVGLAVWLP